MTVVYGGRSGSEVRVATIVADCQRYTDRPAFVIAGDFKFHAGGDAAGALREAGFQDAVRLPERRTTTAHHPRVIDWIFVSDTLESNGRVHNDVRASDHYPVTATVTLPAAVSW